MRYLFINTVAGCGSTGRIVAEKCRELMAQGSECMIAYGRDAVNCDDIRLFAIGNAFGVRIHGLQSRLFDSAGFASAQATRALIAAIGEYDPDVIWLHNLHGYYLHVEVLFDYLRDCGKKIIWTLHDCWAFTGHCPYFDYVGCDRWKTGCHDCPQKKLYPASLFLDGSRRNYFRKKAVFTGIPNLTLQVPSKWLKDRVAQSFLGDYPVEVVPNRVDTEVFHSNPGDFRSKYGLSDKKIVLGVANVWEPRKGLDDFLKLAELLDATWKVVLIGLTPQQITAMPRSILALPRTSSVQELVQAYSEADVYVCTSREETFGMTVLEAACCGTPVIVLKNTACEEAVEGFRYTAVEPGAENIYRALMENFA